MVSCVCVLSSWRCGGSRRRGFGLQVRATASCGAPVTKGRVGVVIAAVGRQKVASSERLAQTLPPKFLQQTFNVKVPHFESLCRIFRRPITLHKKLPDVGRTSHLFEGACDRQREPRANWSARASPSRGASVLPDPQTTPVTTLNCNV